METHEPEQDNSVSVLKKIIFFLIIFLEVLAFSQAGCVRVPEGVSPITGFDLGRYLGRWYEIARLDHWFERGLENVFAEYRMRHDGGVAVVNRGYDPVQKVWKEARGKAYFVEAFDVGRLKVSFFGPFYGAYTIIALDQNTYSHALVCGPDRSYLWILSRTPKMDATVLSALISRAESLGFDTKSLIHVKQDAATDEKNF